MLGSSVFGARPHLVLVVAHDRRGPYSALRACALRCAARAGPGDRERALPSFPRARVSCGKRKACGGLSGDSTDYPLRPIANANASPSSVRIHTRTSHHATPHGPPRRGPRRETRVRSQRTATGGLAAPRRRPTGPTRPTPRRANKDTKRRRESDETVRSSRDEADESAVRAACGRVRVRRAISGDRDTNSYTT